MPVDPRFKAKFGPLWPVIAWPVRFARILAFKLRAAARAADPRRWARAWRWGAQWRGELRPPQGVLTVAVDATPYWDRLTGVGWYLHHLLVQLASVEGVCLDLYGPSLFRHPNDPPPAAPLPTGPSLRTQLIEVPGWLPLPQGLVLRVLRRLETRWLARQRHDVLFAPNFLLPRLFRKSRGALVVTVHDLALRHFRWTLEETTLVALEARLEGTLQRAAEVITPSRAVRRELLEEGLVEPERVTAVHHGPGLVGDVRAAPEPVRRDPYALFVGTLEPRKNLVTVVGAWRRLAAGGEVTPLVACGRWGWKDAELRREVERASHEGWLEHRGYVADEELASLYAGATLLVCPSLYEGFGLPVLEALAVGCPVVCSDLEVFREVAGDAAIYVPATDVGAWAEAVSRLLGDAERRAELAAAGPRRAEAFDWRRAVEETLVVWRRAARRGSS